MNIGTQSGVSPVIIQGTFVNDTYWRRRTAWTDFIEPLLPNDNLDILILTRVNKILVKEKGNKNKNSNSNSVEAIGVETENLGTFKIRNYYARKEVIIAGGAYDTPKLLMLSGIGDCDVIEMHNIDCKLHLPGVGKNLQDHIFTFLVYHFISLSENDDDDDDLTPILSEIPYFGINDNIPPGAYGAVAISNTSRYMYYIGQTPSFAIATGDLNFVNLVPILNRADSIGSVELRSNDPGARPVIDHNYLGDENGNDIDALVEGFKIGREIIENSNAFDDLISNYDIGISELFPGSDVQSDEEIKEYIRNTLGSSAHPTSSCKMGKQSDVDIHGDDSIVVNEKLQVIGVDGLRISDASIMPIPVSANINQMTMVIGKKAGKLIAQDN